MRVLFLSSEVVPYSKTGGLGDVAGALPAHLRKGGLEVRTVTPLYEGIRDRYELRPAGDLSFRMGGRPVTVGLLVDPTTDTWFVDDPALYARGSIYTDDPDEHVRFAVLTRAALEVCRQRAWKPDVIHANDWQTGLAPVYVRGVYAGNPVLGGTPTIITIHNMGYQGSFGASAVAGLGLEGTEGMLHQEHLRAGRVNFLESAVLHASFVTTVSPTYAHEIQTQEGGFFLDGLLRIRTSTVAGILNGIDTLEWNPRTDRLIPYRYSERSLWRKEWDKRALLEHVGLTHTPGVPVVGIITRLVEQKGIDLMPDPLGHFLDTWDLRVVALGSGHRRYEDMFRSLADRYPGKLAFVNGYDVALSHRIEAGSDIFLMPSLYEPCGLNQMYSLAYGTAPVVRRVGGLADTVAHFDPATGTGTGFVFDHYTVDGLGWALGQALTLHTDRRSWQILQRNAMAEDNSWERRAGEYEALYRRLAAG
jgi:starch synthase